MTNKKELTVKDLLGAKQVAEEAIYCAVVKAVIFFREKTGMNIQSIAIDNDALHYINREPHRTEDLVRIKVKL